MKTEVLADFVHSLHVGSGIVVDNLTMTPLLAPAASTTALPLDYIVLDDAIASKEFEISEVSEAGSVPELRVVNRGARPVLIVDGEELLGAKQNRVVNLTILVPAHAEMTIPVSCVEAGRWREQTHRQAIDVGAPLTHERIDRGCAESTSGRQYECFAHPSMAPSRAYPN
jgi:hypothetical protein